MINKDFKKDFLWFEQNDLVYLDNAATTLKPKSVIEASVSFNEKYAGYINYLDNKSLSLINELKQSKQVLADFLGADVEEIFYTSGATESLNEISIALEPYLDKNDEILISYMEHGSNILPWYRLRKRRGVHISFFNKDEYHFDINELKQKISKNTKVIAFANASNLLALSIDIKDVIKQIKTINPNVLIVVDATQYLEHFSVNCHIDDCDFLVGSAHKLLGPTGLGFLYIKKNLWNRFNKQSFALLKQNNIFSHTSSLNYEAIYCFKYALEYWNSIGYETIRKKEKELKELFLDLLKDRKDLIIYNKEVDSPLITFNFINHLNNFVDGQDIEFYLEQKRIITRSSLSCAKLAKYPLCTRSVIRASMLFYNDTNDIKSLAEALNNYQEGDELNGLI